MAPKSKSAIAIQNVVGMGSRGRSRKTITVNQSQNQLFKQVRIAYKDIEREPNHKVGWSTVDILENILQSDMDEHAEVVA